MIPIFQSGKKVYSLPTLEEIREYAKQEFKTISDEMKRLHNPHIYHVDLSKDLWDLKYGLLNQGRKR